MVGNQYELIFWQDNIINTSNIETTNFNKGLFGGNSLLKDTEEGISPSSNGTLYTNLERPMQKDTIEGSESDQNSYLSEYQESLMNTCSEIINSLASASDKTSEDISKNIKVERSGSTEQDDWISGFGAAISTDTTNETNVTIKQELQSGRDTFYYVFR